MKKSWLLLFLIIFLVGCQKSYNSCQESNGNFCVENAFCNGELIETGEEFPCCIGLCEFKDIIDEPVLDSFEIEKTTSLSAPLKYCSELGGIVCNYSEECEGNFLDSKDINFCCSGTCEQLEYTTNCNLNTICENYESNDCKDCQCSGTICNNICYDYKGTCCDNTFLPNVENVQCEKIGAPKNVGCSIPGTCFEANNPLIVSFEIPEFYFLNEPVNAKIIIKNNVDKELSGQVFVVYNKKFRITYNGLDIEKVLNKLRIKPGEEIIFPVIITALKPFNFLDFPWEGFSRIWLTFRDDFGHDDQYISSFMKIVEKIDKIICGNKLFFINGLCIEDVFYPEADCEKETRSVKDYVNFCANRISLIDRIIYDEQNDELRLAGDVKAKGTKKVLVGRINNNLNLNLQGMQSWTDEFFDVQARNIVRKELLDFDFRDVGILNLDWNKVNDPEDLIKIVESSIGLKRSDYDFFIGYTEKSKSKIIFNESSAVYLKDGHILIDTADLRFFTVAHEINHGFGAPDFYINTSKPISCTSQFINDLMCGSTRLNSVNENPDPLFDQITFYSAPFIGWGDVDGDGILDVEDNRIIKIPSWSRGIQFLEVMPQIATQTSPQGRKQVFSILVVVLDKTTQKLVPTIVSIKSNLFNVKTYTKGLFLYSPKIMPTQPIDITVSAETGHFKISQVITFDPATYKYTPSKFDDKIHRP